MGLKGEIMRNTSNVILETKFSTAENLMDILLALDLQTDPMFVEDQVGNSLCRLQVVEKMLSDGSFVTNIRLLGV